jgi:hypothetical protein
MVFPRAVSIPKEHRQDYSRTRVERPKVHDPIKPGGESPPWARVTTPSPAGHSLFATRAILYDYG